LTAEMILGKAHVNVYIATVACDLVVFVQHENRNICVYNNI